MAHREAYIDRKDPDNPPRFEKSEQEWKELLPHDRYRVMRRKGTEMPFTGEYTNFHGEGIFECAACGNDLFSSETKFDSGSGWPSFYAPLSEDRISTRVDTGHGMSRTEVLCSCCDSHLGHVFTDGPRPTGRRYCINSICLHFVKDA